jgi:hypothetical protein
MRLSTALFLSCLILPGAFSCRQDVVDSLSRLAEQKNIEGMMALFAADFMDFEGRDKKELRSLLSGYLSGRTGIVVHRLSVRILNLENGYAELEAEVALSAGAAAALRRLVRISPDIYRIRTELVKEEGKWLVSSAEWTSIGLSDILPESRSVIKKLFPRL